MKRSMIIAVLAAPIAGAILGRLATPFLAGAHRDVKLAAEVWAEQSTPIPAAQRSLESQAFHTENRSKSEAFARARRVESQFRLGGMLLGLWCGLIVSAKLFALSRAPKRDCYDIDLGSCVACSRCFETCPREQLRRGEIVLTQDV